MNASLTINHEDKLVLFFDEPLGVMPQWASIDVDKGEVYIGGKDIENKTIKLAEMDERVYERVKKETQILLVLVEKGGKRTPLDAIFVPLTIAQQI